MDDKLITKLLEDYKKKKLYDYNKYHNERKFNTEFIDKNRQRAKDHYRVNKENRKEEYIKNKDIQKSKNLYHYYRRNNNLQVFILKHIDKYNMLLSIGFIKVPVPAPVPVPALVPVPAPALALVPDHSEQ